MALLAQDGKLIIKDGKLVVDDTVQSACCCAPCDGHTMQYCGDANNDPHWGNLELTLSGYQSSVCEDINASDPPESEIYRYLFANANNSYNLEWISGRSFALQIATIYPPDTVFGSNYPSDAGPIIFEWEHTDSDYTPPFDDRPGIRYRRTISVVRADIACDPAQGVYISHVDFDYQEFSQFLDPDTSDGDDSYWFGGFYGLSGCPEPWRGPSWSCGSNFAVNVYGRLRPCHTTLMQSQTEITIPTDDCESSISMTVTATGQAGDA